MGVLADTHVYPFGQRRLPEEVVDLFRRFGVGLILHAGDVNTVGVLTELAVVAPVLAVVGNNDGGDVRAVAHESIVFGVGPHRLAMLHGHGGASAFSEAKRRFAGKVACVVYGHSHVPRIDAVQGTLIVNPGSATDRRWGDHFGVGLLFVTDQAIRPELVLFQDPRHLRNIVP